MHEQLVDYHPKEVPRRGHRGAKSSGGGLFGGLGKWFGGSGRDTSGGGGGGSGLSKLEDVPKGMYLYGDVGTGKVSSSRSWQSVRILRPSPHVLQTRTAGEEYDGGEDCLRARSVEMVRSTSDDGGSTGCSGGGLTTSWEAERSFRVILRVLR